LSPNVTAPDTNRPFSWRVRANAASLVVRQHDANLGAVKISREQREGGSHARQQEAPEHFPTSTYDSTPKRLSLTPLFVAWLRERFR
jgi:hypothetical protein